MINSNHRLLPKLTVDSGIEELQSLSSYVTAPYSEFVIKLVSRCNLNCSYCYMYNLGDNSYKGLPKFMSSKVSDAFTSRVISHAYRHGVGLISIGLHGGEPLLYGKEKLRDWVSNVRSQLNKQGIKVKFAIQTNGTLIDEEWATILAELRVGVGVSIDGPERFHNLYRVDHAGRGSFDDVYKAIKLLQNHEQCKSFFGGVLCVINKEIAPKELFAFVLSMEVASFDIRLPLATHDHVRKHEAGEIGKWLVELFDLWFDYKGFRPSIRMFNSLIDLTLGLKTGVDESFGQGHNNLVVIETDGSIEPSDNLKPCGEGFTKLKLNVLTDEFDAALDHPLMQISRKADNLLCNQCLNCEFVESCGGGHTTERYSSLNGFKNPSVYCEDYKILIHHIQERSKSVIPPAVLDKILSINNQ